MVYDIENYELLTSLQSVVALWLESGTVHRLQKCRKREATVWLGLAYRLLVFSASQPASCPLRRGALLMVPNLT